MKQCSTTCLIVNYEVVLKRDTMSQRSGEERKSSDTMFDSFY